MLQCFESFRLGVQGLAVPGLPPTCPNLRAGGTCSGLSHLFGTFFLTWTLPLVSPCVLPFLYLCFTFLLPLFYLLFTFCLGNATILYLAAKPGKGAGTGTEAREEGRAGAREEGRAG